MDGVTVMRGCRGDEVFQPLETFFPIIGKIAKIFSNHWKKTENFPTIGKKFSNHWKKVFQSLETFMAAGCVWAGGVAVAGQDASLALQLDSEKQWSQAALEFRRLALGEEDGERAAGWYWMAAREYSRAGDRKRAWKYLDRAEDADSERALELPLAWLRARQAEADKDWGSAAFFYGSLGRKAEGRDDGDGWRAAAARGEAAAHLREKDYDAALDALGALPDAGEAEASREAIRGYAARGDKRPWVGGVLGMVPGLGYAYSGEWGNMVRSMILNGLFIWAMVETAEEDQWALFGVSTFFELTWYTGSIYGGIDAAHRHNRERLDGAVRAVQGDGGAEVETGALPVVRVRFRF
jgi:tetratricopeptide (TPR) repeat protein